MLLSQPKVKGIEELPAYTRYFFTEDYPVDPRRRRRSWAGAIRRPGSANSSMRSARRTFRPTKPRAGRAGAGRREGPGDRRLHPSGPAGGLGHQRRSELLRALPGAGAGAGARQDRAFPGRPGRMTALSRAQIFFSAAAGRHCMGPCKNRSPSGRPSPARGPGKPSWSRAGCERGAMPRPSRSWR